MNKIFPQGFLKIVRSIGILLFILTCLGIIYLIIHITKETQKSYNARIDLQIKQTTSPEKIKQLEEEKRSNTLLKIFSERILVDIKNDPLNSTLINFLLLLGPSLIALFLLLLFSVLILWPLSKIILNESVRFQWLYAVLFLISLGLALSLWLFIKTSGLENNITNPPFRFDISNAKDNVSATGSFIADVEMGS